MFVKDVGISGFQEAERSQESAQSAEARIEIKKGKSRLKVLEKAGLKEKKQFSEAFDEH